MAIPILSLTPKRLEGSKMVAVGACDSAATQRCRKSLLRGIQGTALAGRGDQSAPAGLTLGARPLPVPCLVRLAGGKGRGMTGVPGEGVSLPRGWVQGSKVLGRPLLLSQAH